MSKIPASLTPSDSHIFRIWIQASGNDDVKYSVYVETLTVRHKAVLCQSHEDAQDHLSNDRQTNAHGMYHYMATVFPWLESHLEPLHSGRLQLRRLKENFICHHKLIFWTLDACPGNNFYGISLIGPVIPVIMIGQRMWASAWGRERAGASALT